jgi:hypothetical protein
VAGFTLAAGKPARAAVYQPLLRRAVAAEWETAFARLAAGGAEANVGIVSREGECDLQEGRFGLPRLARRIGIEPYRALFLAALHDRILDRQEHGVCLFIDWDTGGLGVYAVDFADGNARLLNSSFQPAICTVALGEAVARHVLLPAAMPGGASLWNDLESEERARLRGAGEGLLRRCWLGSRERFVCAIPPVPRGRALARGAVLSITREALFAQCRLALAMAVDALDAAVNHCDAPLRVVVSGEAARWHEFQTAARRACADLPMCLPPRPESFAARGAALAVAEEHLGTKGTV